MNGLSPTHVKRFVVIPTLTEMGAVYASPAAVNLLTGTYLAESGGVWLRQKTANGKDDGVARGLWEMEPVTHDDCWLNWLLFPAQMEVASAIRQFAVRRTADEMVGNMNYACAMARIKYFRAKPPLPAATDAAGLSAYHKIHYNTAAGAADAAANVALFRQAIAA